jgi:predicted nucleic acid-binding protein
VKLLADTGALLALFNPRDTLHERARRFAREAAGTRFVVTELILSETVTRLRARTDADRAADVGAALLNSRGSSRRGSPISGASPTNDSALLTP